MNTQELIHTFTERKAYLQGHFRLSSGLHSDGYLQCALVLQHPELCERYASLLAGQFKDMPIDTVIGPALGGVIFAYEVARQLKVRGIFAEREAGAMTLRRGFSLKKGERVLIVEDVLTTGGSVREVIELVKSTGAVPAAVGCIIDRSGGAFTFPDGIFHRLAAVDVKTYAEGECPLCKEGVPVSKPGSRT